MIKFKAGYKYQLAEPYMHDIDLGEEDFETKFIDYQALDNTLLIHAGYAWDGATKPAINTKNFRRGSLVHDSLYQLIREDYLPRNERLMADQELRRICREDGMSWLRAWWVYRAVRLFASKAVLPSNKRPVKEAP